jgi:hypothetical protein
MRKSTLLWLALAAFSSVALFHTSQKVHDKSETLAQLEASITKEEESLRVLQAEWGYLNKPARLEKLSKTYLHLSPLKGQQFAKIESIPMRGATPPPPVPEEKKPVAEAAPVKIVKPVKPIAAAEVKPKKKPAAPATTANAPRDFGSMLKSLSIE